jgi:hypothetical protein
MVNHVLNKVIAKINLQTDLVSSHTLRFTPSTQADSDNIIYFMGAYSSFSLDTAPHIVIHDKLGGLYILNFTKRTKHPIWKPKKPPTHSSDEWEDRYKDCDCEQFSVPMRDGLVVHRDARQMFLLQQNTLQVINYEATETEDDVLGV